MQILIDGHQTHTLNDFFRQCADALGSAVHWRHDLDGLHALLVTDLPDATELVWQSADVSAQAMGDAFVELKDVLEDAVHVQRRFGWGGAFRYRIA